MTGQIAMRESGISWIGEIPTGWHVRTLYQLVTPVKNKNTEQREQNLLSLSYGKVKRKDINTTDGLLPASFDGYNIIDAGDIVLRLTDLQNDHTSLRVGHSTERGIITSAYTTLRPISQAMSRFLYYVLYTFDIRKGFYGMGSGVRQGLNYDEVKDLRVVIPGTEDEQVAIAAYLDEQCELIDAAITEAKASIEEYKAWRASIIYEAVTNGLDPSVEMKDSGIVWIGCIPCASTISRVGRHYNIILGKMLCSAQPDPSYTLESYYCAANVHFDGVDEENLKQMWFSVDEKAAYLVTRGDLLVVEGGAGAGGCAIVDDKCADRYIQNSIMIVRSRSNGNVRYLRYLLEALVKRGYIDFVCNKATIPHFTKEKLGNVPIPIFSNHIMEKIADYLDKSCKQIEAMIADKALLITSLEDYKKSLIYEAVTGKRKVV